MFLFQSKTERKIRKGKKFGACKRLQTMMMITVGIIADMFKTVLRMTQLAGAAEYTECISAEGQDSPNECPGHDTKQSDSEASVMRELWGMLNTSSPPSLPGPLWPRVVTPDRVLSVDQRGLKCILMLN